MMQNILSLKYIIFKVFSSKLRQIYKLTYFQNFGMITFVTKKIKLLAILRR